MRPTAPKAERADYGTRRIGEHRLRDALAVLNPSLPVDAIDDAFRKLTRAEGSTAGRRATAAFHRMLVNGVEIEYRDAEGRVRGGQVQGHRL